MGANSPREQTNLCRLRQMQRLGMQAHQEHLKSLNDHIACMGLDEDENNMALVVRIYSFLYCPLNISPIAI